MAIKSNLYKDSLALLTDLYQLTMAYGYWKLGRADQEAAFHMFFRRPPFGGGFSIACGLGYVREFLERFGYEDADLEYLSGLRGGDGEPLFEPAFLDYLRTLRLAVDVDAVAEGTAVFPQEPLVRVTGPILHCQLLETPLLNMINFQTLIATKAARVCLAARGEPVLEFGLRRAQGIDGAMAASRAAYVGGCDATSNVLAGKLFGIPVKGTHAHSWVMAFDTELESFEAYAQAMPGNCVFLVDTYDTVAGVRNAVRVGRKLREAGAEMLGVRIDSGDLALLSKQAREILDAEGFADARILASNELDENLIASLKEQGATICVWGVGTRLATAYDSPALDGVYKLTATREAGGPWQYRLKLSEQVAKITTPGILQVRRFGDENGFVGDMIYDVQAGVPEHDGTLVDPLDMTHRKLIAPGTHWYDLLEPVLRAGEPAGRASSLDEARRRACEQLARLPAESKRRVNPAPYPVGLERGLHALKTRLILRARRAVARHARPESESDESADPGRHSE